MKTSASCRKTGNATDCARVYRYYRERRNASTDADRTFHHINMTQHAELGCKLGDSWMCIAAGAAWQHGVDGKRVDLSKAAAQYTHGCELGSGRACADTGIMYEHGNGLPADKTRATQYYKRGCELKYAKSCDYYAAMEGVDPSSVPGYTPAHRVATLEKACTIPVKAHECTKLAVAYEDGDLGLGKDIRKAENLYRKVCREARDASACYLAALTSLDEDTANPAYSAKDNQGAGMSLLLKACRFGKVKACEMTLPLVENDHLGFPSYATEAHLQLCLQRKSLADCAIAGKGYAKVPSTSATLGSGTDRDDGKALLAWLTACREHNRYCVEAADAHLVSSTLHSIAHRSRNLALGILETACARGDAASCARKGALVAAGGGALGSYIDPMRSDNERYMLARFDLDSGNVTRGRETMEWLAAMHHTDAEYALASAYLQGMKDVNGETPWNDAVWKLVDSAAAKGHPEAAMRFAVHAYGHKNDGDREAIAYVSAISRAIKLDAPGAREFDAKVRARTKAWLDQRQRDIEALNRSNIASRYNMDRQTVQHAWDQYYQRQKEQDRKDGGTVCGTVYGQGNSTYRTCMSRKTANKYYRGNL